MIKQYFEVKEKYPDAILFYRMGDFYEMFFKDANYSINNFRYYFNFPR